MSYSLPEIAKTAELLMLEIVKAVKGFPSEYRYELGKELRAEAIAITVLVERAWRDKENRDALVERIKWDVDALKVKMQLCSRLRLFKSLEHYEALARIARSLGRQASGWLGRLNGGHPTGQNAQDGKVRAQRAKKLSTRNTSQTSGVYQ